MQGMQIGKKIRLERIMDRNTRSTVIVPLDHGLTAGPIEGLSNIPDIATKVSNGGANAVVLHRGAAAFGHRGSGRDLGFIMHLSGGTILSKDPNQKVPVATVEDAIRMGADAVSVHVNLGADDEAQMLKDFGAVSSECQKWGMPLLAMMYVRGQRTKNPYDPALVAHAARVGAEMGSDIVKVPYTGSSDSFRTVVQGCGVPVVIAGGEAVEKDVDVLKMVADAKKAGGAGVSIGRNVFQHRDPATMVRAIAAIVHYSATLAQAKAVLTTDLPLFKILKR